MPLFGNRTQIIFCQHQGSRLVGQLLELTTRPTTSTVDGILPIQALQAKTRWTRVLVDPAIGEFAACSPACNCCAGRKRIPSLLPRRIVDDRPLDETAELLKLRELEGIALQWTEIVNARNVTMKSKAVNA